jgi:beta-lactam-binding protein with PASTA domain
VDSDFSRRRPPDSSDTLTTLVDVVAGTGRAPAAAPVGDPRLIGRRLEGRYEILRALDRGGMATVYVALDHRLDREVAVKVMHPSLAHDPEFVARFRREARSAASIRHRNVVAVTDAGADGDVVFLVMELVRGRTLRTLLTERGPLRPAQALEVVDAVLSALAAAHGAGLVHRDVKPENVLLGDDGAIEVADFGLARAVEGSSLTTHAGLLLGTVAYVSPEQVSHGRADARSDVYATGVLLFEMLTGAVPYLAETPVAVAYRHVHERVPPPSSRIAGIPTDVDDLVLAATVVDPDERYADSSEFLAAVRRVRRTLPPGDAGRPVRGGDTRTLVLPPAVPATAPTPATAVTAAQSGASFQPPPGAPARTRRRLWPWVLAILVLISAGAGVGGWLLARDARIHVPQLGSRSLGAVESALTADHLPYVLGAPAHSDSVAAGLVLTTVPPPGTAVKRHSTVVIQPSAGVLLLTVPAVVGSTQAQAMAALAAAGFPAATIGQPRYSTTVAIGTVLAVSPAAGTHIDHRSHVTLTVSAGPAPVTIPNEQGQPLADANQTLTSLGLHTTVTQAYSTTVPQGVVISANPDSGTGHVGDTVALLVSKGPALVTVPNLDPDDGTQAAAALRALGLVPNEVALFGIHGGAVVTQEQKPGSMVPPGSTITYYTAY